MLKKKWLGLACGIFLLPALMACGANEAADEGEVEEPVVEQPAEETPEPVEEVVETADLTVDIVIVGAGGAGMSAALQAHQYGAENILIVEQMPMVGGNTLLATGRMQAAGTSHQDPDDGDSVELYFEDIMNGGGNINNEELVRVLVENSADALYWLNDNFDTNIVDVGRGGGASAPRSHGAVIDGVVQPMGSVLVPALSGALAEAGIPVMLNTEATAILTNPSGEVIGIQAAHGGETFTIHAGAVIMATGGFGANFEMLTMWDPSLDGFGTSNHVGASGTGILLAEEIGATLVDMYHIQAHPTGHPGGTLLTEAMRGEGSILVNLEGERFVDELGTRDAVSNAILDQTNGTSYMIFDGRVRERLAIVETYIASGIVVSADSLRGLAEELGIDPETFEATIERYNYYAAQELEPDFDRAAPFVIEGDRFYAVATIPVVHHTMGGLVINTDTQVLNDNGGIIPGLFAAGEVVGGIHGNNRLGGNAITDIVVFGRIAAREAVQLVSDTAGLTDGAVDLSGIITETAVLPQVQGDFPDGVFEGTAPGYGGDLSVRVTIEGGNIVSAYLFDHNETPIIYETAERGVIDQIIMTQSLEVDAISGATLTSEGIVEAIRIALDL